MANDRKSVPDQFLRAQAKPRMDPWREPFVGNESTADNLQEAIQIRLWNALREDSRKISAQVRDDNCVELRGTVVSEKHRATALECARCVEGVGNVIDHLEGSPVAASGKHATPTRLREGGPSIYVRRFCASDEASTSAAIRQAVERLDSYFAQKGHDLPNTLYVVYRNVQPHTVTLEIAMPAIGPDEFPPDGELQQDTLPVSTRISVDAVEGYAGLLQAEKRARSSVAAAANGVELIFWQRFDAVQFRPWRGHPQSRLYLNDQSGTPE